MDKIIIFVSNRPESRMAKEIYTLSKVKGFKIHLIVYGEIINLVSVSNYLNQYLESYTHCFSESQFRNAIRNASDLSKIFHVHNEPNWPARFVRDVVPDARIIFDMHDSRYWFDDNKNNRYHDEDLSTDAADVIIVPSNECKKELEKRTDKPVSVLYSATPLDWYVNSDHEIYGGLACQGAHTIQETKFRLHKDYTLIYRKMLEAGKKVYAFSPQFSNMSNDKNKAAITNHYRNIGCHISNVEYMNLLHVLGNHDWNLSDNWTSQEFNFWKYAMPVKLFDAIAAGIPSVSFCGKEIGEFLKDTGFGIVCNGPSDLIEQWNDHYEYRRNVMKDRENYCMENFIDEVIKYYEI